MEIGKLNQRITILEYSTKIDNIGNHKAQWDESFSCWAAVSVKNSAENSDNGTTKEVQTLQFMIRQNTMTMGISATANRISFRGEVFENIAFIMAKHADPENVPDNPDDFLEQFNTFSIYEILPQLIELWGLNTATQVKSKKNIARLTDR